MGITEGHAFFALTGAQLERRKTNFRHGTNSLKGYRHSALRWGIKRSKGLFVATPQIERNCPAPTARPLKPKFDWRDY
jgi:hypothetical protein